MAQGYYGTESNPLANLHSERIVLTPHTSGEPDQYGMRLRTDLDSGNRIATVLVNNGSVGEAPVYPDGTSTPSGIAEGPPVYVPGEGWGFIPIYEQGGTFEEYVIWDNGTRHGVHDSLTAVPNSGADAQWNYTAGSGTTVTDVIGSADASFNELSWGSGTGAGDTYGDLDGSNDVGTMPSSTTSDWAHFVTQGQGTLFAYILPDSLTEMSVISAGYTANSTDRGAYLGFGSSGELVMAASDGSSFITAASGSGTLPSDDSPAAIAGTMDGNDCRVYVAYPGNNWDVTQVGTDTIDSDSGSGDLSGAARFGADNSGSEFYDGGIDISFKDDTAWTEAELQSFVDDTRQFYTGDDNALTSISHQQHTLSLSPMGEHYNGTTYVTYGEVTSLGSDNGMDIIVGAYDHSTGNYTTTTVGQVYADNHFLGSITVDSSGFIWLGYDWRSGGGVGDGGENIIVRSDSAEDINSFSQVHSGTEERNYGVWGIADGDLHHFHREGDGTGNTLTLFVSYSTDGGTSWSEDEIISLTDRWCYPGQSYVDGTDIHFVIRGRDQASAGHIAGHLVYDAANKTLRGTDGTDLPSPASESDLTNADSVIVSSSDRSGAHSVVVDGGNPRVAYREGDQLKFAEYASGSWATSVVDTLSGSATAAFITESNGSDITIHETWLSNLGDDFTIGEYTSSDGGSSWSSRSVGRSFDGWPFGPNVAKPINNADPNVVMIAVEQTDVDNIESAGAEVRLLDDNLDDVEIS